MLFRQNKKSGCKHKYILNCKYFLKHLDYNSKPSKTK